MEANTPNGMENHCKKSKQKVECTDNGHNRCLGGDAEEYGGKEVGASWEKQQRKKYIDAMAV